MASTLVPAALQAGEPDLEALHGLWLDARSPAVGQLLVDLERQAARPTLRAPTVRATVAAFDASAASASFDERMQWLSLVPVGKVPDAHRQLETLADYPPDPRIAAHLLGLFAAPPFRSRPTLPWWHAVLAGIVRCADASTRARLEALVPELKVVFSGPMALKLEEAVAAACERVAGLPSDEPAVEAAVEEARARWIQAADVDTEALLAVVYEDPSDVTRLAVYADALQAVGDPRGEAIALSLMAEHARLSSTHKARLKQLVKAHRADWLGPLGRVLIASTVKLRHTFLHEAVIKPKHVEEVEAVVGDPAWSTARHLEVRAVADYHDANANGAWQAVERLVAHPVLRSLRSLTGDLSPDLIATLLVDGQRPLQSLQLNWWTDTAPEHPAYAQLAGTDRLRDLTHFICRSYRQHRPDDYGWLLQGSLYRQLQHLELGSGLEVLGSWWTWFDEQTLPLLELTDRWCHTRVRFVRGNGGVSVEATQRFGSSLGHTVDWLETLDDDAIEHLKVSWRAGSNGQPSAGLEARLRKVAARAARSTKLPTR